MVKKESKYYGLYKKLSKRKGKLVVLSFDEIDDSVSGGLPESALTWRQFWGNDNIPGRHSWAWLEAGYWVLTVDLNREKVVFKKVNY